jgi:CBS domain-containing protein
MSLLVRDVMSQHVVTIDRGASVKDAARLMEKYDVGCLIVLDGGKAVGIITERDMLSRVLLQPIDPETTSINEVMSAPLIYTDPEKDLQDAMELMNERRIKRLPVIVEGNSVGILSITDIVRSVGFLEHTATFRRRAYVISNSTICWAQIAVFGIRPSTYVLTCEVPLLFACKVTAMQVVVEELKTCPLRIWHEHVGYRYQSGKTCRTLVETFHSFHFLI